MGSIEIPFEAPPRRCTILDYADTWPYVRRCPNREPLTLIQFVVKGDSLPNVEEVCLTHWHAYQDAIKRGEVKSA